MARDQIAITDDPEDYEYLAAVEMEAREISACLELEWEAEEEEIEQED